MRSNLQKVAYENIREDIISCKYRPGEMIKEEILTEDLSISRTPVREAIARLEQEGLVVIKPKKGILVSPVTIEDVNNVFELRTLYETYAILNYGMKIGKEKLIGEYNRLYEIDIVNVDKNCFFELDDNFHHMIMETMTNRYITSSYDTICAQNSRLRFLTGICSDKRLEKTKEEHLLILQYCIEGNWQMAEAALKDHLINAKHVAIEYLGRNDEKRSAV